MKLSHHCGEPPGGRGKLDRPRTIGTRLLRFARDDSFGFAIALAMFMFTAVSPVYAVQPGEMLAEPALEARAREVSRELRCLVCRNQSIDDSDADLAHDLRVLVRERIASGDSNDQVIAYVRARYGDFVLLRPPVSIGTWLLWGGPLLILLLGGAAVAVFYRRRGHGEAGTPPLSLDEQRRLVTILDDPSSLPRPSEGAKP
jgi:cytochrome c-type biogenesis protein CcmH